VEATGTARLTDRIPAERAVAASVSRREIRDVLQDAEGAPELVIDIAAGDGSQEHNTISIAWSREDLERLLESATENEVVLTFDRNELVAALGDVEAHGLRTRAAIFAVAAAGALGSGVSVANAMIPSGPQDAGGAPAAAQSDSGLQARSEALNVQYGLGSSASDAIVTDASTGGGYATQDDSAAAALQARSEAMNEEYGLTAGGVNDPAIQALQARGEAMNAQFGLGGSATDATITDASSGGYVAPTGEAAALQARSEALNAQYNLDDSAVQGLQARSEAMNSEYGLGGAASDATVTDASTSGYSTPTATDGGSFTIQAPSTDEALLAGAAALMIAGAAFTVRRTSAPRPA
jgi:hypothetical protein